MYTKRAEEREREKKEEEEEEDGKERCSKRTSQAERERELKGILQYTRRGKVGKKRETDRESNFALI